MRQIETTARALVIARIRHFVVGVVCMMIAIGAFSVRNRLAEREHHQRAAGLDKTGAVASIARSLPATGAWVTASEWVAILGGVFAWYHFREWRGKGRRYRNQRRRAANELLRADFRRELR